MIKVDETGVELKYEVDTSEKQVMCAISRSAFELASITNDIRILMLCIDQKYGECSALRSFSLAVADIYTTEDIDKVLGKGENGNE